MKKTMFKRGTILLSSALLLLASCSKDSNSSSATTVSEEEAAEAITQAVTPASDGMVAQVNEASLLSVSYSLAPCGLSYDTSFTQSNVSGAFITYTASFNWGWQINCPTPFELDTHFAGHVVYDAPRMSSNDSSKGSSIVTGLEPAKTVYVINHQYTRNGSQQSKIRNKSSFTSIITISATDITVSKSSYEILSGTSAVTMTGQGSDGKSFSYSGTLVFNGSQKAALTMSSGTVYQLAW